MARSAVVRGPFFFAFFLPLVGCGPTPVSGTYVGTDGNTAALIQLVETPDRHITGRIETYAANSDGAVSNEVVQLDGAADGRELTLLLKPIGFIEAGVTASGTVNGDTLTLSARGNMLKLRRSDVAGYQRAVNGIETRAAKSREIKFQRDQAAKFEAEQAQLLADLDQVQAKAMRLDAIIGDATNRLSTVDRQYRATTEKMGELLRRELALREGDDRRADLANTISSGLNATETLHDQVGNLVTDGRMANEEMKGEWANLLSRCSASESAVARTKCENVGNAVAALAPKKLVVNERIAFLESVFQTEMMKQQEIARRATS